MSKLTPLLETIFMNHGGTPEHWRVSSRVLNEKADEAKSFIAFIKIKLKDLDSSVQSMALDMIDFFMDEGKMPLFSQVSSKDFLGTLVSILKNRGANIVQEKILYLIQKWGLRFEKNKDIIPTFSDIYEQLKKNKAVFPNINTPGYHKYIFNEEEINKKMSINSNSSNTNNTDYRRNINDIKKENVYPVFEEKIQDVQEKEEKTVDYSYSNYVDINTDKFPNKYKKFVAELNVWMDNITLANETIENTDYKKEIDEYLRSIILAIRAAEKQLISIIQTGLEEEDLMNICLIINDDINKTLNRYECLKKKKKPEPFLTGFLESDSIHPKFKVKRKETVIKPTINVPKIIFGNKNEPQKSINSRENNSAKILEQKLQPQPVKDVNDIFDLFGNNLRISDNKNDINNISNQNQLDENRNDLNPNHIIDMVSHLSQIQKNKNENIIDLSQLNANQHNNIIDNDIKISNDLQQNKKVLDLEELLKSAYQNNPNDNLMNQQQNIQNTSMIPMQMYGLPSNMPMNNQYNMINPNPMMHMPILNPQSTANNMNMGMSSFPMDPNGNLGFNNVSGMTLPNNLNGMNMNPNYQNNPNNVNNNPPFNNSNSYNVQNNNQVDDFFN